ncbi:MAG: CHAT domain-containing protein [Gammaproteobacteria bacterium]|nr:CHAT domain-containing protein [Gammaproteobacteria bacterium]
MNRIFILCFLYSLTSLGYAQREACDWQSQSDRIQPEWTITRLNNVLADLQDDGPCRIALLIELSDLYRITDKLDKAEEAVQKALGLARPHPLHSRVSGIPYAFPKVIPETKSPDLTLALARALNAQANLFLVNRNYRKAFDIYGKALGHILSSKGTTAEIHARILANMAQLQVDVLQKGGKRQKRFFLQNIDKNLPQSALRTLEQALQITRKLPELRDKAAGLLHLSQIAGQLSEELSSSERTRIIGLAVKALREAEQLDPVKFPRLLSYAKGYLGEFYLANGQLAEALRLTRQARFFAQQEADILYLWERQLGKIAANQGQMEKAVQAYQRALIAVEKQDLRPLLLKIRYGSRARTEKFRETSVAKTYLELIDLLFGLAKQAGADQKSILRRARAVIERFKRAELENHFRDPCLAANRPSDCLSSSPSELTNIGNTAILYPLFLPGRIELLLYSANEFTLETVKIDKRRFDRVLGLFSGALTQQNSVFLPHAQQLYQWLIKPVSYAIGDIDTLAVVPDGGLHGIPFAALHDGHAYLLERYAVAVIPAVGLIKRKRREQPPAIFLNALAKAPADFRDLRYAEKEIQAIKSFYPSKILLNNSFTVKNFIAELNAFPYSIVHIASHGRFSHDPGETFLLTHDFTPERKGLYLDDLQTLGQSGLYRSKPIELLTLSACEGAAGNEKAALGLSGAAVKAGVNSVVASLWKVNDLAACHLMEAFYQNLRNHEISMANALRKAQMKLLRGMHEVPVCGGQGNHQHPNFWAAFILVGNWR